MTIKLAIVRQDAANYLFHWDAPQQSLGTLRATSGGVDQLSIPAEQRQRLETIIESTIAGLQLLHASTENLQIAGEKTSRRLEELGRFMFNFLLPTALKRWLQQLPEGTAVLLATNDTNLPWELLHDGHDFLALKFAVGRQLLTPTPPTQPSVLDRAMEQPFLFITNPTGELAEADKEAHKLIDLCDQAPENIAARQISHSRANKAVVLEAFGSGLYDLVHYAGHATPAGLCLADGLLSFAELTQVLSGQPCIFLNGCQSAAEPHAASTLPLSGLNVQNLATAFILQGARLFIGALWELLDGSSREFAEKFYALVLNGVTVGEALRQSRQALYHARPTDPLWASYVLYGDPCEQIVSTARPETRAVTLMDLKITGWEALFDHLGIERGSALQAQITGDIVARIRQYEGTVFRQLSHHLCAVFGLADAYEDAPIRSIRAAHAVWDQLTAINGRYQNQFPLRLQAQVGISSGQVLTQRRGQTAELSGKPVTLVAQLAEWAAPGEILTDTATYRFTRTAFRFSIVSPDTLPEANRADTYYRGGTEIEQVSHVGKLVGRQYEMNQLQLWWREVEQGAGHLVNLVGQAGIGKTRLAHAFQTWLDEQNQSRLTAVCYTYTTATSYALLAQLIRSLAGIQLEDTEEQSQRQLTTLVQLILPKNAGNVPQQREGIALLGQVLELKAAVDPVIDALDPELRQRRLAALLQALLAYKSQQAPLLITLEDLHWADEASLAVLQPIIAGLERRRILLLATYRPEWQVPWGHWTHGRQLNLQELSSGEQIDLLQSLLQAPALSASLTETILPRTGGNPLFIEETIAVLRESTALTYQVDSWTLDNRVATQLLPDKVEQLVLARLRRLSEPARVLLQTAVVMGQEFGYALLEAVLPDSVRPDLDQALDELIRRELIFTAAGWLPPQITYAFKHGLIQQIIYADLLDSVRRRTHRQIAQALPTLAVEGAGIEQIAYHAYQGDDRLLAVASCLQAANRAAGVWANQTAVTWYDRAYEKLASFDQVPPLAAEIEKGCTEQQRQQWVVATLTGQADMQLLLGDYETAVHRYQTALDTANMTGRLSNALQADIYRKIADAYQGLGDYDAAEQALATGLTIVSDERHLEKGRLYLWQGLLAFRRGRLLEGLVPCRQGIEMIREAGNLQELARAYNLEGVLYRNLGRSEEAMAAHQQSIALYEQASYIPGLERAYSNFGCVFQDVSQWDQALHYFQQSADLSERTGEVWRRVAAAINLAEIFRLQGKFAEALTHNRQAQSLALAHDLSELVGITQLNLGIIYLKLGDLPEAQTQLTQCQQLFADLGTETYLVETLCGLATLHLLAEEPAAGLSLGQEALAVATQQKRPLALGSVNRVLGQAHRRLRQFQQAEACLLNSLQLFKKQDSPYETGVTLTALARLYADENKPEQAATGCDQAIAIFAKLGAGHDLTVAQSLREKIA
ncbi:MAG: tetratricopeptide repeat protein [Anaerolineales bacterium]|nr:tetratricopeptide repeat protein [Anaerolineales bacterium]